MSGPEIWQLLVGRGSLGAWPGLCQQWAHPPRTALPSLWCSLTRTPSPQLRGLDSPDSCLAGSPSSPIMSRRLSASLLPVPTALSPFWPSTLRLLPRLPLRLCTFPTRSPACRRLPTTMLLLCGLPSSKAFPMTLWGQVQTPLACLSGPSQGWPGGKYPACFSAAVRPASHCPHRWALSPPHPSQAQAPLMRNTLPTS